MNIKELKQKAFLETLHKNKGNRSQTAKELGISIRTARNWIAELKTDGAFIPSPINECKRLSELSAWERRC